MASLILILFFLPLAAAGVILLIPSSLKKAQVACAAVAAAAVVLLFAALIQAAGKVDGFILTGPVSVAPALGLTLALGVDSVSAWLAAETGLVFLLALLVSGGPWPENRKPFLALLLLLLWSWTGFFVSLNLGFAVFFWSLGGVLLWVLFRKWPGVSPATGSRPFGAWVFLAVAGLAASVILIGSLYKGVAGRLDFSYLEILRLMTPLGKQWMILAAFCLAFIVFFPMWPFHAWLLRALEEMHPILAAVVAGSAVKVAFYGLFRFAMPLAPLASHNAAPTAVLFGLVTIGVGAAGAWRSRDLRRIAGYAVMMHAGLVLTGLWAHEAQAEAGVSVLLFGQGLIDATLVLLAFRLGRGKGLYLLEGLDRDDAGPRLRWAWRITALAAAGIPGTALFAGSIITLKGLTAADYTLSHPLMIAAFGIVLLLAAAAVMARLAAAHPGKGASESGKDLSTAQVLVLVLAALGVVLIGFAPGLLSKPMLQALRIETAGIRELAFATKSLDRPTLFDRPLSAFDGKAAPKVEKIEPPAPIPQVASPMPPTNQPDAGMGLPFPLTLPSVMIGPDETKGIKWKDFTGPDGKPRRIVDPQWFMELMKRKGLVDENGKFKTPPPSPSPPPQP